MQNVKTAWHKINRIIDTDEVYLTAPQKKNAPHWGKFNPRVQALKEVVREMGKLPKFVIDDELMSIVRSEDYQQSLLDMQRAGVLRLPFPAMTVEFGHNDRKGRALVMIRDNAFSERLAWEAPINEDNGDFWHKPFYGIPFRIEIDGGGEYLIISPGTVSIQVEERDGQPWVGINAQAHDVIDVNDEVMKLIKDTYAKEGALIWQALACAFLVLHTDGVKREVIDCAKMNRKRAASNKEPIPTHTVISIGKVYRSSKSSEADNYTPRRSPRPHWRRGHLQTVHYGTGREKTRQVYINPKLVAYKEFEGDLVPQEYHVKR